ncbi:hypothetical protein DL93DRAFT_2224843 [Clavulina sp. PMI_390]|nr:hypothetical protein DL93DRAFT_2224843 [Clavulina sp. PMI_390]
MLDPEPGPVAVDRDYSVNLAAGSIKLLVQGCHFQIPKSLLQLHSQTFSHMIDSTSAESDEPLELDDPIGPFQDLRAMLFTPLDSCLNPKHSTTQDLSRLLPLIVLLHKYEVVAYEEFVLELIKPLVTKEKLIDSLSERLSPADIVRMANLVGQSSLASTARQILHDSLWEATLKISPFDMLRFGEEFKETRIQGAAYYRIMLMGQSAWQDSRLSEQHRQNLLSGMMKCGAEWQYIFDSFAEERLSASKHPIFHKCCWKNETSSYVSGRRTYVTERTRLDALWRSLASASLPWYDLVGKVEVVIKVATERSCVGEGFGLAVQSCATRYPTDLAALKAKLIAFFDPEVSEEMALQIERQSDAFPSLHGIAEGVNEAPASLHEIPLEEPAAFTGWLAD